jgi:hypothetical protein
MAPGKQPDHTDTATAHPAVLATAGLLHHRRGWIWMLVASVAGFIVAVAFTVNLAPGGTAYVLLSVVEVVMLLVFLISLTMVIVDTSRLRRHPLVVREPARAVHRSTRRSVLAHPHDRHRHPVAYTVGWIVLAGWIVGGAVMFPRLIDSVGYLAGAGGRATFVPSSYVEQCTSRVGCTTVTNGVLKVDGHASAATWPAQVPLDAPFTVREPVWRWALGSGLINGDGTAIGTFVVCLLFDAAAVLALYIAAIRPLFRSLRRSTPPAASPARPGGRTRPGGPARPGRTKH